MKTRNIEKKHYFFPLELHILILGSRTGFQLDTKKFSMRDRLAVASNKNLLFSSQHSYENFTEEYVSQRRVRCDSHSLRSVCFFALFFFYFFPNVTWNFCRLRSDRLTKESEERTGSLFVTSATHKSRHHIPSSTMPDVTTIWFLRADAGRGRNFSAFVP